MWVIRACLYAWYTDNAPTMRIARRRVAPVAFSSYGVRSQHASTQNSTATHCNALQHTWCKLGLRSARVRLVCTPSSPIPTPSSIPSSPPSLFSLWPVHEAWCRGEVKRLGEGHANLSRTPALSSLPTHSSSLPSRSPPPALPIHISSPRLNLPKYSLPAHGIFV